MYQNGMFVKMAQGVEKRLTSL